MSLKFWFILLLNICWVLAASKVLWSACKDGDILYTSFLLVQVFTGWVIGLLTGLVYRGKTQGKTQTQRP